MEYLKQAAAFVRQGVSSFTMPHLTDWVCTGTGGTAVSVDVADVGTLGATYVIPINVNVAGGTTEIALRHRTANLSVMMEGTGGGFGVGLGWSLAPVSGTYGGGKIGNVLPGIDLPSGGIGCLVAGPKANSIVIAPADLEGFLTMRTFDVSFGANGFSGGIAIFADRPVLTVADLIFIKAFGLVWGIQFVGGAVGVSGGGMVFRSRIREGSLPFPGARYGASVMPT
jgi:hypothetical protein